MRKYKKSNFHQLPPGSFLKIAIFVFFAILYKSLVATFSMPSVGYEHIFALSLIKRTIAAYPPWEQHKLIHTLISKVVVFEDKIQIHFEAAGLAGLLKEAGADFEIADGNQMLDCVITVPCLLRRSSGKLEIQVESEDVPEQPMTPLKTAILQAHQGMAQMTSGKAATMQEIANKLKMDRSYLARTPKLANLAPDIVKLIWENRQPKTLTLDKLRKGIPESRKEQRKLFLS